MDITILLIISIVICLGFVSILFLFFKRKKIKENPVHSDAPDSDQEVQDMKGKVKELRTQILHLEKEKKEALDHLHKNEAELDVLRKNSESSGTFAKVEEYSELEEEIEDLKDEISDLEKKIRRFREE